MAKARILVVEDDNIVAMELRDRLLGLGYTVAAVASYGEEAVERARETRPDLVLMDIRLRGAMDGVEAAEKIRARFDIPVVYLTAYTDEDTLQRAKVTEPYGYIIKPFEERDLHSNIEMALYKHEMEGKLRESERWLAITLRSIGDAVIATDVEGRIILMNPVAEILTGWKQEDALGKDLTEVFHTADTKMRKAAESLVARVIRQGIVVDLTNDTLIAKDGREMPIDHSVAPIRDDKGSVSGVALIFRDITKRKRAEEAYRALVEHSPQGLVIVQDFRIVFANPTFAKISGYTVEELRSLSPEEVRAMVHPEDQTLVWGHFRDSLEGKPTLSHYEYRGIRKDGTVCWLEMFSSRIEYQGKPAIQEIIIDITESKQTEEAVRASQKYARDIIDSSLDMIIAVDTDRHIVEFNKAAEETFGYRREEVLGVHVDILYADPQEGFRVHREAIEKGRCVREILDRRKNGEVFPCFLSASVLRDVHGELVGVMGVSRDITEHKQADEAFKQHASQLALLNDIGGQISAVLTLESVLDRAARLVQESFGYHHVALFTMDQGRGELVMRARAGDFVDLFPSDHRIKLGQGMVGWVGRHGEILLANDVHTEPCYTNFYPDMIPTRSELSVPIRVGEEVVGVLDAQSPLLNAFDESDMMVMETLANQIAVAIENARLHQRVQRRVEELTLLNRVSHAITSSLDLEQVLTTVLEETGFMLGTEAGSILLLDEESNELVFEAAVGPRSKEVKGLRMPLEQGIASWVVQEGQPLLVPDAGKESRFYPDIDGATGFVTKSVLAVPLKVKGKLIGVIEAVNKTRGDFSQADVELLSSMAQSAAIAIENARLYKDLQDRMEELTRTQTQLIQSAKLAAIGELAASLAHEINNPLTSIIGFTRLLLQKMDDDCPKKQSLEIIDREAARTKTIVQGLLDFARRTEPRLESADVNEIVQSTITLIHLQARGAGVTIKESCAETLPLVLLDADQIKQVFLNIMTNAIQAMPEGGEMKIVTAYQPRAMDGADCVAVEFHDSGMGIPSENLPRIFDPFFTTKEVGRGTGLGLSVSHGIVERHGGRIEVESEVGHGSTFTVMLPVAEG